jgi:hypothetical protein
MFGGRSYRTTFGGEMNKEERDLVAALWIWVILLGLYYLMIAIATAVGR